MFCSELTDIPILDSVTEIDSEAFHHCEELDTVFESVHECARQIGAAASAVSATCRGKCKTVKGYHVRYYDDVINV